MTALPAFLVGIAVGILIGGLLVAIVAGLVESDDPDAAVTRERIGA